MGDSELLRAWAAGDRGAGERLFDAHFDAVARFFRNKVGAGSGVHDDLIQVTFLGCLESLPRFRGEASFRTFLFSVARNVLYKHYRTERRTRERLDFGLVSAHDLDNSPSVVVAKNEEQRLVLEALRRIPIDGQVVLELFYWEDLRASDIAEVLDLPLGTAKTRIRRARQLFELELEDLRAQTRLPKATQSDLESWARGVRANLF